MNCFWIQGRIVDADLNEIRFGEHTVHVEPKIIAVLCELASSPGQVVSRERLLERVWAGVFVGGDVLTNAVCVLRKALGETAGQPKLIQTIHRRGYRLSAAVQELPRAEGTAVLPFDSAWHAIVGERAASNITRELADCPCVRTVSPPHQRTAIADPESAECGIFVNSPTCDRPSRVTVTPLDRGTNDPGRPPHHDPQTDRVELSPRAMQDQSTLQPRSIRPNTSQRPAIAEDTEAKALVLRIRHLRQEETAHSLQDAAAVAESLASMYPDCAAAHAELAQVWLQQEKVYIVDHSAAEPKVRDATERALRLDARSCTTLTSLAIQDFRYDWNWSAAERHFDQAVSSNPFSPEAATEFAIMLTLMGRFRESEHHLTHARALDPVSPLIMLQLANLFTNSGKAERAKPLYCELIRRNPGHLSARTGLILALELLRDFEEAIQIAHTGFRLHGRTDPRLTAALARVYASSGQCRKGWRTLERLLHSTEDPFLLACAYSAFGERARVLRLLSTAAECGHARFVQAAITPRFADLHGDRGFQTLIRHVGLRPSL